MCEQASRYFRHPIGPADVVWSYSGVRPLLDDETGLAFDPDCVAALRSIVASEVPAVSPTPARRRPDPTPVRTLPGPVFGAAA